MSIVHSYKPTKEEEHYEELMKEFNTLIVDEQHGINYDCFVNFMNSNEDRKKLCYELFEFTETMYLKHDAIGFDMVFINRPIFFLDLSLPDLIKIGSQNCRCLNIIDNEEKYVKKCLNFFLPKNKLEKIVFFQPETDQISSDIFKKIIKGSSQFKYYSGDYCLSYQITQRMYYVQVFFDKITNETARFLNKKSFSCRFLTLRTNFEADKFRMERVVDILRLYKSEPHEDVKFLTIIVDSLSFYHKTDLFPFFKDVVRVFPNAVKLTVKLNIYMGMDDLFKIPVILIGTLLSSKTFKYNLEFIYHFHIQITRQFYTPSFMHEIGRNLAPKYALYEENNEFKIYLEKKFINREGRKLIFCFIHFDPR